MPHKEDYLLYAVRYLTLLSPSKYHSLAVSQLCRPLCTLVMAKTGDNMEPVQIPHLAGEVLWQGYCLNPVLIVHCFCCQCGLLLVTIARLAQWGWNGMAILLQMTFIFKCFLLNENWWLKLIVFIPKRSSDSKSVLVYLMAWCWPCKKPLSESMMTGVSDAMWGLGRLCGSCFHRADHLDLVPLILHVWGRPCGMKWDQETQYSAVIYIYIMHHRSWCLKSLAIQLFANHFSDSQ